MRVFADAGVIRTPDREPDFIARRTWLLAADGRYHVGEDGKLFRQTLIPEAVCAAVCGDMRLHGTDSRWSKRAEVWRLPPSHTTVVTVIRTWKLDKGVKCEEERVISPVSGCKTSILIAPTMKLEDAARHITRLSSGS
jgi:hypothetical protein